MGERKNWGGICVVDCSKTSETRVVLYSQLVKGLYPYLVRRHLV